MKIIKKLKAFTLVELIIVITILAILATIVFVSFQNYVKDSRDSTRLTTLKNIESGLQAFQVTTGNYPEPEDYTLIQASGTTIGYQGNIGDTVSKLLKINKTPVDPLDQARFVYSSNVQKTKYQLLTLLEGQSQISYMKPTYAIDYSKRITKVVGDSIGIILNPDNSVITSSIIDIVTSTGVYKAILNDKISGTFLGTGSTLIKVSPTYDCTRIFESGVGRSDGVYIINPKGENINVYCSTKFPNKTFYDDIVDGNFEDLNGNNWNNNLKKTTSKKNGSYGLEINGDLTLISNNFTYIDPTKTYKLEGYLKSDGVKNGKLYYGFIEYDKDFNYIAPQYVNVIPGTETTLVNNVVSTDSTITFFDTNGTVCNNWNITPSAFTGHARVAFNIDDSGGYSDLPNRNLSATENMYTTRGFTSLTDNGTTCTLVLNAPIGGTYPAGTKIRLHISGGSYNYIAASWADVPFSWTGYSGQVTGMSTFGIGNTQFRRGTQFIKIMLLVNSRGALGTTYYNNYIATDYKMSIDDLKLTVVK